MTHVSQFYLSRVAQINPLRNLRGCVEFIPQKLCEYFRLTRSEVQLEVVLVTFSRKPRRPVKVVPSNRSPDHPDTAGPKIGAGNDAGGPLAVSLPRQ